MPSVTFHLRSGNYTECQPMVYGNLPSLGDSDPEKAIPLESVSETYNYKVRIELIEPIVPDKYWYSYCYRPTFGAILLETLPRRFLPATDHNIEIYDSSDSINTINDVRLHFRINCHCSYGQFLYVAGNLPELGSWKAENAIRMTYMNDDWWEVDVKLPFSSEVRKIEYKYFISNGPAYVQWEPEGNHSLELAPINIPSLIEIDDHYHWHDPLMDTFMRNAFTGVLNKRESPLAAPMIKTVGFQQNTLQLFFTVCCPSIQRTQRLFVVGDTQELGSWDPIRGVELYDSNYPIWTGHVAISRNSVPFHYKYVIIDKNGKDIWENEADRYCEGITSKAIDSAAPATLIVSDWYVCPDKQGFFHGFGVYAPLFSMKTSKSCGIGQYTDIIGLVDVCNKIGASLIQLLPINDTTDKGDWADSYPYRQVSCFALHPIFIDLEDTLVEIPANIQKLINDARNVLDNKPEVDYPNVYKTKMSILKMIFDLVKSNIDKDPKFQAFITKEHEWLDPYALYCHFRDQYGTSDYNEWPEHKTISPAEIQTLSKQLHNELLYIYWQQYICDYQFKKSREYANNHHVVLKGDLPIGVFLNSVECWAFPKNFRKEMQAGAPPDDFSGDGQNWKFPTYDWEYMATDGYSWWEKRLKRMSELFQALRVDHVLGFFRIWEIPRDSCIRGMLGHFFPCIPLSKEELCEKGLWDIDRYVKPYVRWHLLRDKFGDEAEFVSHKYFNSMNRDAWDDWYEFKDEYNTEKKIDEAVSKDISDLGKRKHYRDCLMQLLGDVLLLEIDGKYHVRTTVDIEHIEETPNGPVKVGSPSFLELDEGTRNEMMKLYNDFTFKRQTNLWVEKAHPKLNVLKYSTNMLICVEDLGQITEGIIDCLKSNAFISLEVQRMSKDSKETWSNHNNFPYLSVCCPATHDMSSLRGWWEENRSKTEDFWHNVLLRHDLAPSSCEPWISETILKQHLYSDSMWAIFLLQDITGVRENLRRQAPSDERINLPSDSDYHWRYRYPYSFEELTNDNGFANHIHSLVEQSGRI